MPIRQRVRAVVIAFALMGSAAASLVRAQQSAAPAPAAPALSAPMPVDPELVQGKFPNGLEYFIRANKKPEKRAELRLVVKAGSILEDDDQQGLAHFVEHMAFDGTTHFPKKEITDFIQSIGMRFGADLNAGTSFDETIYQLTIPTDKPEVVERAMLVMEDWAHNVSFDPQEFEKERSVVMEEWRLRRGADARTTDKLFPTLLKGSRYADRIPIGQTDIIQHAPIDRAKAFYRDWYRPNLMAVIAVGDFDARTIEGSVRTHFSSLTNPSSPKPRPAYAVPDHPGTLYAIVSDKETTTTEVEVDHLLPAPTEGTVGDYRRTMVEGLFSAMMAARFSEITQKPDAPFLGAFAGRGLFLGRSKSQTSLGALVKEGDAERGFDAALAEAERVVKWGFTQSELDRAKTNMMRGAERQVAEKANRESASRTAEYIRHVLEGESLPSADDEYALAQRLLPGITAEEVSALAKDYIPDSNGFVIFTGPDKPSVVLPTEARLSSVLAAAPTKDVKAYVDTVASATLLNAAPTPGAVVRTGTKGAVGITEWQLANGVKVALKPTTFKDDEILFRATAPGGTSLASDADYIPAQFAAQLVAVGGLGTFSATDLRKMMTGKVASAQPGISEIDEGLTGSASKKDLETMFQLIYLRFTAPRADAAVVAAQAAQLKAILANQTAVPEFAFSETLSATMSQNHPRRLPTTPATVDQWNLDKSLSFYRDRFADASEFTFVFVGSFDLPTIKPLVERYLGSLPALHRTETWKDVGVHTPTGVVTKTVEKGIEPKSLSAIVFTGPFQYDQTQRVAIRAMAQVLQVRLLETIREQLGGAYTIGASANYSKIPRPEYNVVIQFGSDPAKAADLNARVLEEIEKLKTEGPTPQQAADARAALQRDFETSIKTNSYLLTQILLKYQFGEDPAEIWAIPDYYSKIDAAMIQQAAKTYLGSNRVSVTLLPEKK